MVLRDDIRTILEDDLFTELGSTLTLYNLASSSTDKWGDGTRTYSSTAITGVPYDQNFSFSWEKFGDDRQQTMEVAVPYDVTITADAILLYDGVYYGILDFNQNPLQDGNVVYLIALYKHEDQSAPTLA